MKIFGKWIFTVIFFTCLLTRATVMNVAAQDGIELESQNAVQTEAVSETAEVMPEEVPASFSSDNIDKSILDQNSDSSEEIALEQDDISIQDSEETEEETGTRETTQTTSEEIEAPASNIEETDARNSEETFSDDSLNEESSSPKEEDASGTEVSADEEVKSTDVLNSPNIGEDVSKENTESAADREAQSEESNYIQKLNSVNAMEKLSVAADAAGDKLILEEPEVTVDAALMASSNGSADSDYEYTVSDNEVTITKYNGLDSVLNLPEAITGYSVTRIESSAFENNTVLTSVDIPASVYYIGSYAFSNCSLLETVTFHENNGFMPGTNDRFSLSIGDYAFYGCTSLTGLALPDSVTELGDGFITDTRITTITLPKNLTDASCALYGSLVEEIIFADGVIEMESQVIYRGL